MALSVLDTDHVTLFQRAHPLVRERVLAQAPGSVVTTMVTVEEQLRGRLKALRRASDGPSLVTAYDRLRATLEFFRSLRLLAFDEAAFEQFTRLRKQRVRIGTLDLRIAAIVLAKERDLVSRNARDFSRVPGLKLEDWSAKQT